MALFNAENTNDAQVIQQVQMALIQIRDAMDVAVNIHDFAAAISLSDLTDPPPTGVGMNPDTAQTLLSACADAWGMCQVYNTGVDDRHPPVDYNYGASQKLVIGWRLK